MRGEEGQEEKMQRIELTRSRGWWVSPSWNKKKPRKRAKVVGTETKGPTPWCRDQGAEVNEPRLRGQGQGAKGRLRAINLAQRDESSESARSSTVRGTGGAHGLDNKEETCCAATTDRSGRR